jgi:two-component system sensor kinase FixL
MAERSNAPVLKTGSPQGLVGSNPTPSAIAHMPEHPPKPRKLSISRKVILGVAFTLLMLALIAFTSFFSIQRFLAVVAKVNQTRTTLDTISGVQRDLWDIERGVLRFMLSGDDLYLDRFEHGQSFIDEGLGTLRKLTADQPEAQKTIDHVSDLVKRSFVIQKQGIDRRRQGGVTAAASQFVDENNRRESQLISTGIEDALNDLQQTQNALLKQEEDELDAIGSVNTSLVIGGTTLTYIALLVACLFILRDIAERRRAEDALEVERNLLRSIMDTIPDFIYVKDESNRYLRINEAYSKHLGLTKPAEATGRTPFDFYPRPLAEQYAEDERLVIQTGNPQLDKVEPSVTRDGREIWLETTAVPLRDGNGQLLGLVGLSSDVTQRQEKDEKLRHFAQALQRSNEELQNFASVASHDLQEPLRKIQAFGDRLRSRTANLGEQERDYITRMMDAAGRMQTLIQDLLKLSRVTTRALPFETCDLDEIVRGVLDDLEVKISAVGAKLSVAGLPEVEGDPTQLRQLMQNLIANALKFQKPGVQPEVIVTGRTFPNLFGELPGISHAAKICEIRVQDNGIGFDPQFAEQIFGAFKRLHGRAEYEGSGIGLSVCRKITDRHQGRIVAESEEGQGATFIVTLPVTQPRTTT